MVHLDDNDWEDLGIKNKVHQKRLSVLLEPFRTRWEAPCMERRGKADSG